MLSLIRRNKLFFLSFTLLGFALRGYMLKQHFLFEGDSLVYGDLAKNWLRHGVYGLTSGATVIPVDIRMPGYPAFLAACFRLFGVEHYSAVVRTQLVLDLATCFIVAAGARLLSSDRVLSDRVSSDRAAKLAFVMATMCPFTSNYTATPLPETLAILSAALALLFALRAIAKMRSVAVPNLRSSSGIGDSALCGLAISVGTFLRPDGGVLLIAIGIYLLWQLLKARRANALMPMMTVVLASLLPLLPWTVRNWRTLHQFEPLSPFYAQLPAEFVPHGFNRWCKTWVVDFISVMDVEWEVATETTGEPLDINQIPQRAFDTPQQRESTRALFDSYNQSLELTPAMDQQFAQLAAERVHAHPVDYYVLLPMARLVDMWLRPRTEMLNLDLDWWKFGDWQESLMSLGLALLNLFYLVAGLLALRRNLPGSGILWLFILCRSLLLATLPNPEPRYTLECYPAVMMLAGVALGSLASRRENDKRGGATDPITKFPDREITKSNSWESGSVCFRPVGHAELCAEML